MNPYFASGTAESVLPPLSAEPSDLLKSARDLVPLLREHADAADRDGRLPESVAGALRERAF